MQRFLRDFSPTAAVAALLAIIVSYTGSAVIIFQAANLAGLSQELTSSWIWAVSIGSGVTGAFLSWRMKVPIITAWSTPGAALLVVMLPGIPFAEAIGAYLASALIITMIGVTGSLDYIMRRIPMAVSSGMFAGILFSFGARVFSNIQLDPLIALPMFFIFVLFRRLSPRYSVLAAMFAGIVLSAISGQMVFNDLRFTITEPVFTAPAWSWATFVSLAIPLTLVTLTGQYISGFAVLHASGYSVHSNGIMGVTGFFFLVTRALWFSRSQPFFADGSHLHRARSARGSVQALRSRGALRRDIYSCRFFWNNHCHALCLAPCGFCVGSCGAGSYQCFYRRPCGSHKRSG